MFEKNMRLAVLLDFYGDVLDEHTRTIMKAYYEDDLSLAEIAEDEAISRQGVRHVIKKGEEQLEFLEERLKLAKKEDEIQQAASALSSLKSELIKKHSLTAEELARFDEIISTITNKGV